MARKAGPGEGTEIAPEGRAGVSPDGSELPEEARALDHPEGEAESHPSAAADEARVEALSEEGLGAVPAEEPPPLGEAPTSDAAGMPPLTGPAMPDPGAAAPEAGAAADAPIGDSDAADPWRAGPRDDAKGGDPVRPAFAAPTEAEASSWESRPASEPGATTVGAAAPPAYAPPPRRRGGFGGLLLGGMIAAALGFGAAWLAQDRLGLFPARLPADLEERLAALEARPVPDAVEVQGLADRLGEVEARMRALEEAPPAPAEAAPPVDLAPLRDEIAAAEARASDLEERIAALEARPATVAGAAVAPGSDAQGPGPAVGPAPPVDTAALREEVLAAVEPRLFDAESDLAALGAAVSETRAGLDAVEARLDAAEAASTAAVEEARAAAASLSEAETRAATAEAQARTRAALDSVKAALDAGEPYGAALAELEATGASVPEALAGLAPDGAPTLASLRESFPEAARAGLDAARAQGLLDDGSGLWGFLRGQLSVRSVAPREGEDPDAVLSRAEASLAQGRLNAALAEIETLPEPVRAAMADWIAQARARAEAEAALTSLRDATPASDASPAD